MGSEPGPRFEVSPALFPQSARALRDRGLVSTSLGLVGTLLLAVAWVGWLLFGSIPVTVRTASGAEAEVDSRTPLSLLLELVGLSGPEASAPPAQRAPPAR